MDRKKILMLSAVACATVLIILLIVYYPPYSSGIRVPEQYPTIQAAINAAKTGDTIFVASGTYVERISVNKTVTLKGQNRNNTIIDGNQGTGPVVLINVSKVSIVGFTIRNSCVACYGVYIQNSVNSSIRENIFTKNNRGIFITGCTNIMVANNVVSNDSGTSIYIGNSVNVTLRNNELIGNAYGLGVAGRSISEYAHDIDVSNTIDGKPIYYFVNQSNKIVPANAGFVGVVNSVNITVKDMTLSNNRQGLLFAYTKNSTIQNVTVANNIGGILLFYSSNNNIFNNTITSSRDFGISISSYSNNNTVSNNFILKNKSTIFNETTDGIRLENHVAANKIINNTISNNTNNIRVALSEATHANEIYHNNFINSTLREYNDQLSINAWDDGYPSGGNYWSDYTGVDQKNGPNQDIPGSDGIGDTPYVIDADNQDRYPLMNPYAIP
jgi:parallel beta-helix repeat protein